MRINNNNSNWFNRPSFFCNIKSTIYNVVKNIFNLFSSCTPSVTNTNLNNKKFEITQNNNPSIDFNNFYNTNSVYNKNIEYNNDSFFERDFEEISDFEVIIERQKPSKEFENFKIFLTKFSLENSYQDRLIELLTKIDPLIKEENKSNVKKQEFYSLLTKNVIHGSESLNISNLTHNAIFEQPLEEFLQEALDLLTPGKFVTNSFIDAYFEYLMRFDFNGLSYYPATKFAINNQNVIDHGLPLTTKNTTDHYKNTKTNTVLIPVNIDNGHWFLYCFSVKENKLYRYDSAVQFTASHLGWKNQNLGQWNNNQFIPDWIDISENQSIKNLENKIICALKNDLKLDQNLSIDIVDKKPTQQVANNCGVHVCKNAEWFKWEDQKTFSKANPEDFTTYRTNILIASLDRKN